MMRCALRRASNSIEKVTDGGSCNLSDRSLEQNTYKFHPKDPEVSTITARNSDHRCFIFTFVTLEIDARRKFIAPFVLPLQQPDQGNHLESRDVNMNSQDLVLSPSSPLQVEQKVTQRSTCSGRSFTDPGSSGENELKSSRPTGPVKNRNKALRDYSNSSEQKCNMLTVGLSSLSSAVSDASSSADPIKDMSTIDKPLKKSSKKKTRKKGRRNRRASCSHSTKCEEDVQGSPDIETSRDGCISETIISATAPSSGVSGPSEIVNISSSNGVKDSSETPSSCNSYSDEAEKERTSSISQDFTAKLFDQYPLSVNERHAHTATMIQTPEIILSNYEEKVADLHPKMGNTCRCISSGNDISDTLSDGWHSDDSNSANDCHGVEILQSMKEEIENNISDGGVNSDCASYVTSLDSLADGKGHSSYLTTCSSNKDTSNVSSINWHKVECKADIGIARANFGNQGCSSADTHFAASGKKHMQIRRLPGSSSRAGRQSSGVTTQCRTGKENHHSVWQRVQKNETNECITDPRNKSAFHLKEGSILTTGLELMDQKRDDCANLTGSAILDGTLAPRDSLKRVSGIVDSDVPLSKLKGEPTRNKVCEKLQRRLSAGSKKEQNYCLTKEPDTSKISSVRSAWMKQKERLQIFDQSESVSATERVDCDPSVLHSSPIGLDDTKPLQDVCPVVCDTNNFTAYTLISNSLEKTQQLGVKSDYGCSFRADLPEIYNIPASSEVNGFTELGSENPHAEYDKQDNSSGSISQKWVPVGRKDADAFDRRSVNDISASRLDGSVTQRWITTGLEEDQVGLLRGVERAHVSPSSGNVSGSFNEKDEGESSSVGYHTPLCTLANDAKDRKVSSVETDLVKIVEVVNDAYRLQIESEGVQLATGAPLAEFERFLHSASPVLSHTHNLQLCHTCVGNGVIGDSLCRHQRPNISLGNLWQWYERHGSYGLEVNAESFQNSKRLGANYFKFRAYFVPYLSAVQLFVHSRSATCEAGVRESQDVDKTSNNSSESSLPPIFSLLLPQPLKEQEISKAIPGTSLSVSGSSSAFSRDESDDQLGDSELLFEYFECEQPQQRRPLFETIKRLVRGEATSNCRVSGDPVKLESLHLHELHPSSWYSVAWYPIYRIPDGNFRAAFLTYHSLGHFIRRGGVTDSFHGDNTCVVSPVVGLQSYNAQGECWFQPRNSRTIQTAEEIRISTSSEILKERLRTLERTASAMARASVCRRNQKYVNRQPDYEFFLSRKR